MQLKNGGRILAAAFFMLLMTAALAHAQTTGPLIFQTSAGPVTVPAGFQVWLTTLVAHFPKLCALFLFIGALRPFAHSAETWLAAHAKKLTPAQLAEVQRVAKSPLFQALDFLVHLVFSVKPATVIGASQIKAAAAPAPIAPVAAATAQLAEAKG